MGGHSLCAENHFGKAMNEHGRSRIVACGGINAPLTHLQRVDGLSAVTRG